MYELMHEDTQQMVAAINLKVELSAQCRTNFANKVPDTS